MFSQDEFVPKIDTFIPKFLNNPIYVVHPMKPDPRQSVTLIHSR
jgi:hypothetical protein